MAERIPYDRFILSDGLAGDILLRGLYVTPTLHRCMIDKDRQTAIENLHSQYLNGFNIYTPGIEKWKTVIDPHCLNNFADVLIGDITEEMYDVRSEAFFHVYIVKNRSRRGISPLPRLIFGRKGTVITPFCDFEFVQKALSIPIEFKLNQSLYKALLERIEPGLSNIASTNTKDADKLEPYLMDPLSGQSWGGSNCQYDTRTLPKTP